MIRRLSGFHMTREASFAPARAEVGVGLRLTLNNILRQFMFVGAEWIMRVVPFTGPADSCA